MGQHPFARWTVAMERVGMDPRGQPSDCTERLRSRSNHATANVVDETSAVHGRGLVCAVSDLRSVAAVLDERADDRHDQ